MKLAPVLSLLLVLSLSSAGCSAPDPTSEVTDPVAPTGDPSPDAAPDLTYQDITLTETLPDGRILWRLTATVAQFEADQTTARLEAVTGELFDEEGDSVRIRAEEGQVYPTERRLVLGAGVQMQASRYGIQMTADSVEWRADDNVLEAQDQVKLAYFDPFPEELPSGLELQSEQGSLWRAEGSRLTFDFATEQLRLWRPEQQPIQAYFQNPALSLQALDLVWDPQTDQLRASEQVVIEDPERQLTLTAAQLISQISAQTLSLTGGAYVRGQQSDQQLWADRLDWLIGDPVIEATGNVRYQQPGQALTVTGSSGTFNRVANTVAVRGSTTTTQLTLP